MQQQSSLYKKAYGAWAGFPAGHAPNLDLCCEEISTNERWPKRHQCSRKRGHGPDGAYCKQHDPDAVKSRQSAADAKARAKWNEERYKIHGKTFFDALEKIANGHNDARGLAQEVIATFKDGEYR